MSIVYRLQWHNTENEIESAPLVNLYTFYWKGDNNVTTFGKLSMIKLLLLRIVLGLDSIESFSVGQFKEL